MTTFTVYQQTADGTTRVVGVAREPDPNATVCEAPGCGLYQEQDTGIEPGRWIASAWWCQTCLSELAARAWHLEMDEWCDWWNEYPDLMASLWE